MKARTYLILIPAVVLLLLTAYVIFVEYATGQANKVPWRFQQFLLESTVGPKIVVVGSSNTKLSLDTEGLESYFRVPVLNLSDIAGIAVEPKLKVIEPYLFSGDTLILPVIYWDYGINEVLADTYLFISYGDGDRYYKTYPFEQRLGMLLGDLHASELLSVMFRRRFGEGLQKTYDDRIEIFQERLQGPFWERRGSSLLGATEDPNSIQAHTDGETCDEYIFRHLPESNWKIGKQFTGVLKILNRIRDKGVTVIFTYPVTVDYDDSGCYESELGQHGLEFMAEMENDLRSQGFYFVGDPLAINYSSDLFLNTYYHPVASAALDRSQRLLEALVEAGFKPYDNPDFSSEEYDQALVNRLWKLKTIIEE